MTAGLPKLLTGFCYSVHSNVIISLTDTNTCIGVVSSGTFRGEAGTIERITWELKLIYIWSCTNARAADPTFLTNQRPEFNSVNLYEWTFWVRRIYIIKRWCHDPYSRSCLCHEWRKTLGISLNTQLLPVHFRVQHLQFNSAWKPEELFRCVQQK